MHKYFKPKLVQNHIVNKVVSKKTKKMKNNVDIYNPVNYTHDLSAGTLTVIKEE